MVTEFIDGSAVSAIPWSASLKSLADQYGHAVAMLDGCDQTLTYSALFSRSHALAQCLITRYGITSGQPIGVLLPNQVCAVACSYGIRVTGAAEVLISYKSTDEEIQWCMQLSKAKHIITLSEREEQVRALGFEAIVIGSDGVLEHATPDTHGKFDVLPAVGGQLGGRILFTSGTTGKPKGVLYSHSRRWLAEQVLKASLPFKPRSDQKIILMTPFIHGSSLLTYAWCDYGAQVILLEGVEQASLQRYLDDPTVVALFAPPTVLAKITNLFDGQTFPNIQCVFTGTQPLTQSLYRRGKAMFGPVIRITYGKSECVNPITVLTPNQTASYFEAEGDQSGACVGFPAPGVEVRIVPPDEHQDQSEEGDGEVWLRAAHMSLGMLTIDGFKPHEPDGWHQTGDLGHIDSVGRLVLTGRIADVIKTGGYRVNPDEIEACLSGFEGTIQISVTSVPSDYWGEVIIAVAQNAHPDWHKQAEALVSTLSRHKRPRAYVELDTLPRNPQGKISRRLVRQQVLAAYRLIDGPYPVLEPITNAV